MVVIGLTTEAPEAADSFKPDTTAPETVSTVLSSVVTTTV